MWSAQFKNGEVVNQFNKDKKDVPFRAILNREEDLEKFTVTFANTTCNVNLRNGIFTLTKNGIPITICTLNSDKYKKLTEFKYRLIYFQRCIEQMALSGNQSGILFTAVGWQMTENGKNIKRILKIHGSGIIELVEE